MTSAYDPKAHSKKLLFCIDSSQRNLCRLWSLALAAFFLVLLVLLKVNAVPTSVSNLSAAGEKTIGSTTGTDTAMTGGVNDGKESKSKSILSNSILQFNVSSIMTGEVVQLSDYIGSSKAFVVVNMASK